LKFNVFEYDELDIPKKIKVYNNNLKIGQKNFINNEKI
tara:strand:- start:713 stop:826 length:114 start_codon:yes stop_codon:yes gene_type:complete